MIVIEMEIVKIVMLLYGLFLICCGITAVVFIGLKAKTALISGGTSGAICILISYMASHHYEAVQVQVAGLLVSLTLFMVFSWRCAKTLFAIFEMVAMPGKELKDKGIAFLLIGLMAIVSLMVFGLQLFSFMAEAKCR